MEVIYRTSEATKVSSAQFVDSLFPKLVEPTPDAHQEMGSGNGSVKGRPLKVPELGEEDGPKWVDDDEVYG